MALLALRGVGDEMLGQWEEEGYKPGVFHVMRRLTPEEITEFGVPDPPVDIRGTEEEERRLTVALLDGAQPVGR